MAQLNEYQVIVKPVMTEKSLTSAAEGKYTFEVDVRANKLQIAEAVSMVFDVDVVKVNVITSLPSQASITERGHVVDALSRRVCFQRTHQLEGQHADLGVLHGGDCHPGSRPKN